MKISQAIESGVLSKVSAKASQCEYYDLEYNMKEKAKELLEAYTIPEFLDIIDALRYSLWYSQGDGVSFHGGNTEWECLREETESTDYLQRRFTIETNSYSNHYSHNKTFYVECEFDGDETDAERDAGKKRAEELMEDLRDVCDELEKFGYSVIEEEQKYQSGMDTIREFLNVNSIEWVDMYDLSFDTEKTDTNVLIGECEWTDIYVLDFEISEKTRTTENKYFEAA